MARLKCLECGCPRIRIAREPGVCCYDCQDKWNKKNKKNQVPIKYIKRG